MSFMADVLRLRPETMGRLNHLWARVTEYELRYVREDENPDGYWPTHWIARINVDGEWWEADSETSLDDALTKALDAAGGV